MKIIRKIIHDLIVTIVPKSLRRNMLTCEQVSHIIAQDIQLSKFKTFKLQMHLFICQSCLNYKKQIQTIDKAAQKLGTVQLTKEQKEQILSSKKQTINKFTN